MSMLVVVSMKSIAIEMVKKNGMTLITLLMTEGETSATFVGEVELAEQLPSALVDGLSQLDLQCRDDEVGHKESVEHLVQPKALEVHELAWLRLSYRLLVEVAVDWYSLKLKMLALTLSWV